MNKEHFKKLFSIPVKKDFSFYFVIVVLTTMFYGVVGFSFVKSLFCSLLYFLSICVHEYTHAYFGLKFNLIPHSINFNLFGGSVLLKTKELFELNEKDNIKIVLSGPISSIILCVLGGLLWWLFKIDIFLFLFILNLFTGFFNLLPIIPLDGGFALFFALKSKMIKQKALNYSFMVSITTCTVASIISYVLGFPQIIFLCVGIGLFSYYFKTNY